MRRSEILKGAPHLVDPDTFLTAVYGVVDDDDKAHPAVARTTGPAPALSRSEVVTLAIFAQWAAFPSERAFYRYAQAHLRPAFPHLPHRSQDNRLLRRVHELLVAVGQWLAEQVVGGGCADEVLDGFGVATRSVHRQGTGWRYGEADVGRCSRLGWYHGLHLLTVVSPQGLVTGYGTAPAATSEQVVAETLLACRHLPAPRLPEVGRPVATGLSLADTGFEGRQWPPRWGRDDGAWVLTPPKWHQPYPVDWPPAMRHAYSGWRQIVETVHDKLLNVFRLAHERPHTMRGFRARLAATVALHNAGCWLNRHLGRPLLAFADLIAW